MIWERIIREGTKYGSFSREPKPRAISSVAVRCLGRAAMVISEGVRGKVGGEAGGDDEFQALRKEVLSLRKSRKQQSETESSLIQELQRRCNRIIELEVS